MFMPNVPRRKIYEEMLKFEDGIIEMQIITFSEEKYKKHHVKFNEEGFKKLKRAYDNLKVLTIMFLENKKYENAEDFNKAFLELLENPDIVDKKIHDNKNIHPEMKKTLKTIDDKIIPLDKVHSIEEAKEHYLTLCKLNDHIPKMLEIRRDKMK